MSKFSKTIFGVPSPNLPTRRMFVALSAALVLGGASSALAQSKECTVEFSVTSATELGALQFSVDYSAAGAVGEFAANGCVFVPSGLTDSSVDTDADELVVGFADTTAFSGPGLFASCAFVLPDPASPNPTAGQFLVTLEDASDADVPPNPVSPTMGVVVASCVPVAPECQNGVVEEGEQCDDANDVGGDGCGPTCANTGSCAAEPLTGCKLSTAAGKSKILLKNDTKTPASNAKDQGQYQWKSGEATTLADFDDAVAGSSTYSWCVYDNGVVVSGSDVPAGGMCSGAPCWKADGTSGYSFKGDVDGVAGIKLKSGDAGKASVAVKAKSKLGTFGSPGLPLAGPVVSQVVIDDGVSPTCFQSTFTAPSKTTDSQYSSKD